ncbi:tripeptidyl-peptidase 2 isoform X3 [Vitis vinifera]|uniref:tripeptidyl-peptidase 2 isoform X3 n=1 Tax=Vitis vinifera TaxID=29760 RepID=UPI00053FC95D|nr:tripeptidyl-peptidase 2 isoform X3 [Vitis vinifera]|eukprot:XP_010662736.1 PREDICTED: tripeptidyl-peptidase 2 isoform X3 [Vitis vinifera]
MNTTYSSTDDNGALCAFKPRASLVVNSLWKNPYGEWHAGYKFVYEPFTETLTSHLKKERRKKWDERHQESIAEGINLLDEFDKKRIKVEDA